jgi:phosphoribosyl 1,2-cyclic phosphodiesterase
MRPNELEITIHASSSKGNAYTIREGEKRILIDPGIRFSELLVATQFSLSHYDACLISHEHRDHSVAAKDVARGGVPIIASRGTLDSIGLDLKPVKSEMMIIYKWWILPFETQHDAAEPLGFLIQSPSKKYKILYATDTYYIRYKFSGVTHYMIECNYAKDLLDANEEMHPVHKDRVRRSHFELQNVKDFFRAQDLSRTEKIFLIHLSDDNSDESRFKSDIEAVTGKPVYLS